MMQVLRVYKSDLFPIICRLYGTRRPNYNYYEMLEVSPDCSQKEIRRAFLALSKQYHPDIIGDKGHDKFVKLQEAYNILSKEETRKQYDMDLKFQMHSPYASYERQVNPFSTSRMYKSHREWEEHMARGTAWRPENFNTKYNESATTKMFIFYVSLGILLLALQFTLLHFRILRSKDLQQQYQKDYNLLRKNIEGLTFEEQNELVENRMKRILREKEEEKKNLE